MFYPLYYRIEANTKEVREMNEESANPGNTPEEMSPFVKEFVTRAVPVLNDMGEEVLNCIYYYDPNFSVDAILTLSRGPINRIADAFYETAFPINSRYDPKASERNPEDIYYLGVIALMADAIMEEGTDEERVKKSQGRMLAKMIKGIQQWEENREQERVGLKGGAEISDADKLLESVIGIIITYEQASAKALYDGRADKEPGVDRLTALGSQAITFVVNHPELYPTETK